LTAFCNVRGLHSGFKHPKKLIHEHHARSAHNHPFFLSRTLSLFFILAINTLLRIVLLIYTGSDLVPLSFWPVVLTKGLWFDLVVAAVLITPAIIYEALLPNRWRLTGWHNKLQTTWLFT